MIKIKQFVLISIGLTIGFISFSQEKNSLRTVHKKTYVGLGMARNVFQDVKMSSIQYTGGLVGLSFGTSRTTDKYFWDLDFKVSYTTLHTKTYPFDGFLVSPKLNFIYAKPINESFRVGGKWTIGEVYFTKLNNLGNSSLSFVGDSKLSVYGDYIKKINDNFRLDFSLNIGVLGLVKEFRSFAYSTPQVVLENGEFDFQNSGTQNPFSFKYYSLKTIGRFNTFETSLKLNYKKRWVLYYDWSLFNYTTVKGYPLTIAQHVIGLRFNYINKNKNRVKK